MTQEESTKENKLLDLPELQDWIEVIGIGLEVFAVAIIAIGILIAAIRFLKSESQHPGKSAYYSFKVNVVLALLLGLEVLVAADIINSIAADDSLESLAGLALLVVIRTFLTWTLTLEIEGRWPWQQKKTPAQESDF